jgi:hypothetical protein
MRVLHFSAEPICDERLMLSAELRAIADALLPGKVLGSTVLESVPQTRPSDVDVYLRNSKPDVVHFSMHGTPEGLSLCDAYLDSKLYSPAELAEALEGQGVKLVVLNACDSEAVAEAIVDKVDVVVATRKTLSDDHAIVFSEVFYRSLQVGLPVGKAFNAAMRELKEVSPNPLEWYRLLTREAPGEQNLEEMVLVNSAAENPEATPTSQQRLRGAASRLEAVRYGAAQEAKENRQKLIVTLLITVAIAVLVAFYPDMEKILDCGCDTSKIDSCGWFDRNVIWPAIESVRWVVAAFSWIQLNAWLLFTFFAAPPAIYLIEYFWLRRPLEEAERAAFGLALKAPEAVDPDELVGRVEALVEEMNESKKAVFDLIQKGQKDG